MSTEAPRRVTLRPHDRAGDAPFEPLFDGAPADAPVVSFGADGVDPDAVEPALRTVPASSGHVVLDYDGRGASELVLSAARMRAAAERLGSANLVVCVPHPGRLLLSTPHPVAVAVLESLGGAAYDVVARNGGPALSRRLWLVREGRITEIFEPGTLAARRAVGVSVRGPRETTAPSAQEAGAKPPPTGGFFGWLRRVTGA